MKTLKLLMLILSLIGTVSCTSTSIQALDENWPVIARWEVIKGDSVIVCDIDKVEPTTTIPLDAIAEDFQIVKLDKEAEEYSVFSCGSLFVILSNLYLRLKFFHKE